MRDSISQTANERNPDESAANQGDILIVDDQPENLQLLFDTLSNQHYELRRVLNGQLALQVATFDPPDLILLDIRMPGLDGYEVCRRIKADPKTQAIPVIFLSALDEPLDKVKAFEAGGADYISKPFQVPEVLARVQHQVQLKRLQEKSLAQQQQLQERAKALEAVNQELALFSSSVSHDLRAPLRGLQGLSEVLLEDYGTQLDEMGQDCLQRIKITAVEMDVLLQTLLDYSRMGRARIVLQPVALQTVVESAVRSLQPTIEKGRAEINIQENLPGVVGVPLILEQVATNLLNNALKYIAPGDIPKVFIGAKQTDRTVRWFFQDSGIGVEEEKQARIFKPFERLHGRESYPGHGFGLAIVERGVTRLGGRCGVASKLGEGSCFWVELPASAG